MSLVIDIRKRVGDFFLEAGLKISDQGVTVLFGPSGCGKTSLLRAIAGLDRIPGAKVRFQEVVWQDDESFVSTHLRALGYVFQEPGLFPDRSVRRNLEYGYHRTPEDERRIAWEEVVRLLGLEDFLERSPETLSGGERQRVAIGRALLSSPQMLMMDEPLASLDRESKRGILPFLERLHRELALPILYVTHDLEEAARLGDHLVLMEPGKVRCEGPMNELLTRLDLPFAFSSDALALIQGRVNKVDAEDGLVWLEGLGAQLAIVGDGLKEGDDVRLRVRAQDVALTLERHTDSSVLNVLGVTVAELAEKGAAQVIVRLETGGSHLIAHITRRSARALNLEPGKRVFAQVKCSALSGS